MPRRTLHGLRWVNEELSSSHRYTNHVFPDSPLMEDLLMFRALGEGFPRAHFGTGARDFAYALG